MRMKRMYPVGYSMFHTSGRTIWQVFFELPTLLRTQSLLWLRLLPKGRILNNVHNIIIIDQEDGNNNMTTYYSKCGMILLAFLPVIL